MKKHETNLSMEYFLDDILPVYIRDELSEKQIRCAINFYDEDKERLTNEDIKFYLDNCSELDEQFTMWMESQTLTPSECCEMTMIRNLHKLLK